MCRRPSAARAAPAGRRSFTIGPFYAKPELLIGFAAAVACTIALRFMLQATYLTFCRPSL
jgi:hypothetical protein